MSFPLQLLCILQLCCTNLVREPASSQQSVVVDGVFEDPTQYT